VAFNAPHIPLQAKPEDLKLYGYDESLPSFSGKDISESFGQGNTRFQTYAAMVTCMDRGIGNILEAISETGIEENTLIVFMSDNGPDVGSGGGSSGPLRGHKFMEFEGGVRVPAIVRWPAKFKGGRVTEQLTGFIDLFPTFCDILTPGKMPAAFDGISILDVLVGNKENIARDLYLGCGALIENNFKFILAGQNARMKLGNDVLFNLKHDPLEQYDISAKASNIKVRLMKKVKEYDSIIPTRILPPYDEGRKNFSAPAEWNLFPELN
jgi:arylsulfatase B